MRILNIHRKDPQNVGDMKTSPFLYFKFGAEQETLDVLAAGAGRDLSGYDAIIFGGGGLLQNQAIMASLARIRRNYQGRVIVWGAGLNSHFQQETMYFAPSLATRRRLFFSKLASVTRQGRLLTALWRRLNSAGRAAIPPGQEVSPQADDWLKSCDLAGIRDYGTEFEWLPCVSCMDERLDYYKTVAPQHRLVAIDHPDYCRIELKNVPHFSNLNNDFESILAFVASGETVLSSSYHAAYWALLLGRKVVVVPWSEKFYRFKHAVPACRKLSELPGALARAQAYPGALAECRNRNLDFAARTGRLLGVSWAPVRATPQ